MVQRKTTYYKIIILVVLTTFYSCEIEYPWNIKSKTIHTIVVDGIITNEYKSQCIKLSTVNSEINAAYQPISGAIITVNDSTATFQFNESATIPGSYYSAPFQGVANKKYNLNVEYQSKIFTASAKMIPLVGKDSFKIIKENNLYKYVHISGDGPSMTEVYLDWSSVPDYCTLYGYCQVKETFYILNNVDVNKILAPDKEIIYFPSSTKIIRRRYSLSDEHQTFLRSLLMETEWRGGIFDVQQGNVLSNISNGGLGFFGACTVVTDSLVVK